MMKVKELIEKLQEIENQDADIIIDDGSEIADVNQEDYDRVYLVLVF